MRERTVAEWDGYFDRWYKYGWLMYPPIAACNLWALALNVRAGGWSWAFVPFSIVGIVVSAWALRLWLRGRRRWAESTARWQAFLRDTRHRGTRRGTFLSMPKPVVFTTPKYMDPPPSPDSVEVPLRALTTAGKSEWAAVAWYPGKTTAHMTARRFREKRPVEGHEFEFKGVQRLDENGEPSESGSLLFAKWLGQTHDDPSSNVAPIQRRGPGRPRKDQASG